MSTFAFHDWYGNDDGGDSDHKGDYGDHKCADYKCGDDDGTDVVMLVLL